MGRRTLFLLCLLVTVIVQSGCSKRIQYSPGLVTQAISGIIADLPEEIESPPFVLVLQYDQTFLKTSHGNLRTVTARIVHPEASGFFRVKLGTATRRVDLLIIASGYQVASATFVRSLGVGEIEYTPELKKDPNWKENFYYSLRPFLSEYITEKRYKMPDHDQLFLGKWLEKVPKN